MIKATIKKDGVNKDLFLWLHARESGKDKLIVFLSVNETEELCKERMEAISEHYWRLQAGIGTEIVFDGGEKFETQIVDGKPVQVKVDNPLTAIIEALYTGADFRTAYHELVLSELKKNVKIIKSEILL